MINQKDALSLISKALAPIGAVVALNERSHIQVSLNSPCGEFEVGFEIMSICPDEEGYEVVEINVSGGGDCVSPLTVGQEIVRVAPLIIGSLQCLGIKVLGA